MGERYVTSVTLWSSGKLPRRQLKAQLSRQVLFDRPDDYPTGFLDRLEAVTFEEVRSAATTHLTHDGLMVLVVGDREAIEPGLLEIGLPIVHVDHEGRPTS